jgi:hypothetical protein
VYKRQANPLIKSKLYELNQLFFIKFQENIL